MINRIDIRKYSPTLHDILFFDNNVWMYLFCPLGNHDAAKQRVYSSFFQSAIQNGSTIYINSLVLSEFANSFLRLDFKQWCKNKNIINPNFKRDYIPSKDYLDTALSVKSAINQILKKTERMSDNFNAIDTNRVLDNLSVVDFNDSYYEEYCKISNLTLVTDDRDFSKLTNSNITVLTA